MLADHPAVEARILDEIAGLGADPAPEALDRLAFTRQVVLEVMRLYPPAPLIVRRTAEEVRLGDTVIPAGNRCMCPSMPYTGTNRCGTGRMSSIRIGSHRS